MTTRILKARRAYPGMPGDTTMRLTRSAVDSEGKVWAAGSMYTPLCGGIDNVRGCGYANVMIDGKRTFYGDDQSI